MTASPLLAAGGCYFERGKRRPARSSDSAGNELPSLAFETGNESRRNLPYINNFLYCSTRRNASPDRDARVIDAVEKLMGGEVGIIAAKIIRPLIFADSEPEPAVSVSLMGIRTA